MAMVKWREKLLVGFYDDGLHEFAGGQFKKVALPALEKTSVNHLTIDSANRLWISSNRPFLLVLDSLTAEPHRLSLDQITEVNFLAFINPTTLLMGTEGSAYLQTISTDRTKITATRELTYSDGFVKAASSNGTVLAEPPFIWFATNKGLYRFDSRNHSGPTTDPLVYFTGMDVEGVATLPDSWYARKTGFFGMPDSLRLPYTHNAIRLSFMANNFSHAGQTYFRYKMEPIEDDWRPATAVRQVTYAHLAPGRYTFQVQAQSGKGSWVSVETFSFEIVPAFWQTRSFVVAATLTLLALGLVGVRSFMKARIRQLKRDEKIRMESAKKVSEQVAMDFHDELGNKLAAIVAHTNALKLKQNRNDADFESILHYVEDNAKQVYQGTRAQRIEDVRCIIVHGDHHDFERRLKLF